MRRLSDEYINSLGATTVVWFLERCTGHVEHPYQELDAVDEAALKRRLDDLTVQSVATKLLRSGT